MKKSLWQILCVLVFLVSACAPSATSAPTASTQIATSTPSPLPSATPTITVTPLPTIPTFTLTFDVSTIVTVTPAPKAECPKEDLAKLFDIQKYHNEHNQFIDYVIDFLGEGGSIQSIRTSYEDPNENIRNEDITGDGISEVIIAYGIWIDIFKCNNGNYELANVSTTQSAQGAKIIDIVDLNSDGVKELISYFDGCMGSRCPSIEVIGWDGQQFKSLVENPNSMIEGCSYMNIAPFQVELRDIDNNKTIEIILQNVGNPWPDDLDFPFRKETRICMWNGTSVALHQIQFDKPYYRFQALQDGERIFQSGNYLAALDSFNQTINNKDLEWMTRERLYYDFWIYHANYFPSLGEPTPTASPSLQPDPAEYPSLAAYAYYRIILINLVQNQETEASTTYNTLQQEFGSDPYGRPYVEMASAFWEAYQSTHKMYDGCAAAIQYAVEHPDILTPLGSDYHGSQSHQYKPEDVCPFR